MSSRRDAAPPPRIPGYAVQRLLGVGGSADVFLYEQERPHRQVAVKVLLGGVDVATREAFGREADLTARLSHHPSIVTVYQAGVADDGRPFLVMEFCSRPGLGQRYRSERFDVPEVLQLGVRLASAVETAHRAGIVHRDIKPGNVLTNDFGRPVLSDFGIAAYLDAGSRAVGMSIPWAAPELLAAEPRGDERSDVYSLAATLFSALAGRSPFERPGGGNEAADLVGRIERGIPVPPARDDLPDRLRTVLARAIARDPQHRHPRAVDLAHDLRAVEADLGLPLTPLDIGEDPAPSGGVEVESDATRVRSVVEVAPRPAATTPVATGPATDHGAGAEATRLRPVVTVRAVDPSDEDNVRLRARHAAPGLRRPGRALAVVASAVVVVGVVVAVVALASRPDGSAPPEATSTDFAPAPPTVRSTVPSPAGLTGTRTADGAVVFTWTNPDPESGDTYLWGRRTATGEPTLAIVDQPRVTVTPDDDGEVCLEVSIVRTDRRASATPAQVCVP